MNCVCCTGMHCHTCEYMCTHAHIHIDTKDIIQTHRNMSKFMSVVFILTAWPTTHFDFMLWTACVAGISTEFVAAPFAYQDHPAGLHWNCGGILWLRHQQHPLPARVGHPLGNVGSCITRWLTRAIHKAVWCRGLNYHAHTNELHIISIDVYLYICIPMFMDICVLYRHMYVHTYVHVRVFVYVYVFVCKSILTYYTSLNFMKIHSMMKIMSWQIRVSGSLSNLLVTSNRSRAKGQTVGITCLLLVVSTALALPGETWAMTQLFAQDRWSSLKEGFCGPMLPMSVFVGTPKWFVGLMTLSM